MRIEKWKPARTGRVLHHVGRTKKYIPLCGSRGVVLRGGTLEIGEYLLCDKCLASVHDLKRVDSIVA